MKEQNVIKNIELVTFEELYIAYQDCLKNKRNTVNAIEFTMNDTPKLYQLWKELNNGTYKVGPSIAFCIDRPVQREVFAADFRDRIVHHLLANRTDKYFEEEFIDDSYSCRKNKGVAYGRTQCQKYIEECSESYTKDAYILKCDLKSFFMSINKNILFDKVERFLKAKMADQETQCQFTIDLFRRVIFNNPQEGCILKQPRSKWIGLPKEKSLFYCNKDVGIPIGNLTSQLLANFFLSDFDHFVKETLEIKYYGRYVDDFFIVMENKDRLSEIINKCREELKNIGVMLHPKKIYVQEVKKGVKFIGAVIKPNRTYVSNRTKGNMYMALKNFSEKLLRLHGKGIEPSGEEINGFVASINSYLGFMKHYNTFNIRKKMLLELNFMDGWFRYCYVDSGLTKLTIFKDYMNLKSKKKHLSKKDYLLSNTYLALVENFGTSVKEKIEKNIYMKMGEGA